MIKEDFEGLTTRTNREGWIKAAIRWYHLIPRKLTPTSFQSSRKRWHSDLWMNERKGNPTLNEEMEPQIH